MLGKLALFYVRVAMYFDGSVGWAANIFEVQMGDAIKNDQTGDAARCGQWDILGLFLPYCPPYW